ncbi:MAG: hypothetical protein EHM19_10000, partial [Candidatus Latescibacterota bacterium]
MWALVRAVTAAFDGLIGLFGAFHPLVGLLVVSVLTGAVMLVIFRYTSNQKGIARAKDHIMAHILEVRLFQDDLRLQLASQRKILAANLRYMRYALAPMIVMLIPVLVILIQLDVRYARRPFLPGETTVLRAEVAEGTDLASVRLELPAGVALETEALRVPDRSEVDWRLRVEREGAHEIAVEAGGERAIKRLEAGPRLVKLADERKPGGLLGVWENPAESPLPRDSRFRSIAIDYPDRDLRLFGFGAHWLVVFFVVSVLFGFAI